jgi:hypothetical protein
MNRTAIFFTGVYLGVLMFTLMGIIFMEDVDSPHPMTVTTTVIGLIGAVLVLIGGIVGAYFQRWFTLLPGSILVFVVLASSIQPCLWVAVVVLSLLLLYCINTTRNKGSDFANDIGKGSDADGNMALMSINL